ncbi:unnamed protein product [Thelazia callipaeda]|uniref:F-box domain-containing protein n=1 Tax=Thelazia callipaeda TaxID=103827 RepID=A0A0N5CQU2_THECL|nr:unnamed protein product [Thelazia callipaeda]
MDGCRIESYICKITGLTVHQKLLLSTTWRHLQTSFVIDLGKRVFELIFERDPNLLVIINLKQLQNTDEWREHANFHKHAQVIFIIFAKVFQLFNVNHNNVIMIRTYKIFSSKKT